MRVYKCVTCCSPYRVTNSVDFFTKNKWNITVHSGFIMQLVSNQISAFWLQFIVPHIRIFSPGTSYNISSPPTVRSAGPSGRAFKGVGLRPLACWDRGFESHRGHGYLSVVSVECCQVEVSATDWSLVQSPTDCGASKTRRLKPATGAAENTTTMACNARKTNKQTNC
jgi:hypothetical protein